MFVRGVGNNWSAVSLLPLFRAPWLGPGSGKAWEIHGSISRGVAWFFDGDGEIDNFVLVVLCGELCRWSM